MKRNFKMRISYDGTRYQGWEHQPTTDMTIQGKIETVLSKMVDMPEGKVVDVIAAGRTDAGVHAKGMIANVQLDTAMTEDQILAYANRYLPEDICIDELKAASDRFHARYNAIGKTYCYSCYYGTAKPVFDRKYVTVLEEMPDVEQMKKAAAAEIQRDRERAVEQLKGEVVVLSMAAAGKIISKNIDKTENEQLITEFVNKLDKDKIGDLPC